MEKRINKHVYTWIVAVTKLGSYKEDFVFADGRWVV
jgi:hypothetical protein